jgi:hypothetical protein
LTGKIIKLKVFPSSGFGVLDKWGEVNKFVEKVKQEKVKPIAAYISLNQFQASVAINASSTDDGSETVMKFWTSESSHYLLKIQSVPRSKMNNSSVSSNVVCGFVENDSFVCTCAIFTYNNQHKLVTTYSGHVTSAGGGSSFLKFHGNGKLTDRSRGDDDYIVVYNGEWKDGLRHGTGTRNEFSAVYTGGWFKNFKSGYGQQKFRNGDVYEGNWSQNRKAGHGEMMYANGDVYTGDWAFDQHSGVGTLRKNNLSVAYVGGWQSTKHCTEGDIYKIFRGRLDELIGHLEKSKFRYKTDILFENGDRYSGDVSEFLPHGSGVMEYANGDVHTGQWRDGKWFKCKWSQCV